MWINCHIYISALRPWANSWQIQLTDKSGTETARVGDIVGKTARLISAREYLKQSWHFCAVLLSDKTLNGSLFVHEEKVTTENKCWEKDNYYVQIFLWFPNLDCLIRHIKAAFTLVPDRRGVHDFLLLRPKIWARCRSTGTRSRSCTQAPDLPLAPVCTHTAQVFYARSSALKLSTSRKGWDGRRRN